MVDLGTSNADVRVQNSLGALTMRADSNGDYGFIGTVGSSTEWLLYYDKADARAEIPHTLKITGDADISGTTTVSGLLKTSENIHLRTDVQKGTIPSAQAYRQIIWYDRGTGTDTATNRLGNITCSINTSGANQMYISVYEPSAASTSNHFLSILYPRSGNATLRWSGEEAYFGGTTDSTAHGVYVSNSVASLALYTSANGNHGLYSATNSAMMLYHESGSTDIVIPHTTRITSGSLGINKTSGTDGNAGFWANASGNLYLTGGTGAGGYIYFFYNKATSSTSYIRESASGELTVNAYLVAKDYSGNSRRVVTSYATDGQRVATFGAVGAQTLYISGQWSTTGTTYTSKTITVSSSDIRLKEHIKPSTVDALNMIEQIKIREFDWKDGRADKHQKIGMVADEIEKLDPLLSVGGGTDENGGIVYKSVDTFYLVGYLVKAVQELSAKVKALEKGA